MAKSLEKLKIRENSDKLFTFTSLEMCTEINGFFKSFNSLFLDLKNSLFLCTFPGEAKIFAIRILKQ